MNEEAKKYESRSNNVVSEEKRKKRKICRSKRDNIRMNNGGK